MFSLFSSFFTHQILPLSFCLFSRSHSVRETTSCIKFLRAATAISSVVRRHWGHVFFVAVRGRAHTEVISEEKAPRDSCHKRGVIRYGGVENETAIKRYLNVNE